MNILQIISDDWTKWQFFRCQRKFINLINFCHLKSMVHFCKKEEKAFGLCDVCVTVNKGIKFLYNLRIPLLWDLNFVGGGP